MKKSFVFVFSVFSAFIVGILFFSGCQTTTKVLDTDSSLHLGKKFDYTDLKNVAQKMVSSILSDPPIYGRKDRPVVIVYGIDNRTDEHIDTKNITDKIRTALIRSRKVKFINETSRKTIQTEIKYQQGGMVKSDTRIKMGQQVGAEYMLTGTIVSMEQHEGRGIRLKDREVKYYKFTMEITDLNTSIIEWTDEKEFARSVEKPFVGW